MVMEWNVLETETKLGYRKTNKAGTKKRTFTSQNPKQT